MNTIQEETKLRGRLLPRIWVMHALQDGEVDKLTSHIHAKAVQCLSDRPGAAADTERFNDWLRFRFRGPLEEDAEAGPDYSKAFNLLSIMTIAAGLAASVIANTTNGGKIAIGVLGIAVGVFTAINRIWNPAQRSTARYQAAYALRREGWDFVHGLGRYRDLRLPAQLETFMQEVGRIHRGVEAIDESAASTSERGGLT
jgi:hypothetical protein